jgi:gas vesicle protein
MFSFATLLLAIILGVQVVQSDSKLRQLFTWKRIGDQTSVLITETTKKADQITKESSTFISQKVGEVKKYVEENQPTCPEVRQQLADL